MSEVVLVERPIFDVHMHPEGWILSSLFSEEIIPCGELTVRTLRYFEETDGLETIVRVMIAVERGRKIMREQNRPLSQDEFEPFMKALNDGFEWIGKSPFGTLFTYGWVTKMNELTHADKNGLFHIVGTEEAFLVGGITGEFEDTLEANHWYSLYTYLRVLVDSLQGIAQVFLVVKHLEEKYLSDISTVPIREAGYYALAYERLKADTDVMNQLFKEYPVLFTTGLGFQMKSDVKIIGLSLAVSNDGSDCGWVVQRLAFEELRSFLLMDLTTGLSIGHAPKRCEWCERYFLVMDGRKTQYCNLPRLPGQTGSCKNMAAAHNRRQKAADDPIRAELRKAEDRERKYYAKHTELNITEQQFQAVLNEIYRIGKEAEKEGWSRTQLSKKLNRHDLYRAAGIKYGKEMK